MTVPIIFLLAIISAIMAITTFILYGRARMKEQEEKEQSFLRVHYISLFILLLLGIVYMFFMVETET